MRAVANRSPEADIEVLVRTFRYASSYPSSGHTSAMRGKVLHALGQPQ